jgi:hypothetical protein
MMIGKINVRGIAFGCLVKPLAAAFGAHFAYAGTIACGEFDTRFENMTSTRPRGRGLMEGPVDGNAIFNASRYRCY